MKKLLIVVCLMTLVVGCAKEKNENDNSQVENENLTLDMIMADGNYVIIDVRTKEEYEAGHVVGAINVPYDELENYDGIDMEKTVMVYCQSGKRSAIAYEVLSGRGYNVFDLGAYDSIPFDKE